MAILHNFIFEKNDSYCEHISWLSGMQKNKNDSRKQSLRNLEKIMLQIMVLFKCVQCFETRQKPF